MPSSVSISISSAFSIVVSLCAMTSVVLFLASFSKDSWTICSLSLSSAEVASSNISIGGFLRNTLAIESLCFCPPESLTPLCPISVSYPFSNDSMNSCALAMLSSSYNFFICRIWSSISYIFFYASHKQIDILLYNTYMVS